MTFNKEIESCLEQIKSLEMSFQEVRESEILPLSFFSSNYDRLSVLKQYIHKIEEAQYLQMQEHLNKRNAETEQEELPRMIIPRLIEESMPEPNQEIIEEKSPETIITEVIEEKESVAVGLLGDKIAKTLYMDLKKSLSLNDYFRFQRELFAGNASLMETTLNHLNDLHSLPDAMTYLKTHLAWNWEDETVCAFIEILEKRFD